MNKLALILGAAMIVSCSSYRVPVVEYPEPTIIIVDVPSVQEPIQEPIQKKVVQPIRWIDVTNVTPEHMDKYNKIALDENRIILMYFYSEDEDCEDCFGMTNYTFMDETVIKTIKKYYYPVKINLDELPDFKKKFASLGKLPGVSFYLLETGFDAVKDAIEVRGYYSAKKINGLLINVHKYAVLVGLIE